MARFRYAFAVMLGVGWLILAAFLLYSSNWSPAASEDWFAFTLPWDDGAPSFVGPWLDGPAGAHGFVQAGDNGDFHFEDGQRARFWGVALGPQLGVPSKELAETLAARLAKLGFNLVRIWGLDQMLFEPGADDTRHLDPERLDRFDYFVKQLKSRGIYLDLVLTYFRRFRSGDGVIDWDAERFKQTYEGQRLLQSMAFVDPYLLMLHKEFVRQLLTHLNPYTGNAYAQEPAVAMLEIINETSLTYDWVRDYLNEDSPESLQLTPYYSRLLDTRWNLWLLSRYGSREALQRAWLPKRSGRKGLLTHEDPTQGTVHRVLYAHRGQYAQTRVEDQLRFYSELEHDYFQGVYRYLKEEVGVQMPVSGTHQFHGMVNQLAQSRMDFAGGHVQWQHPIFLKNQPWNEPPIRVINTPMVRGQAANIPYKADWIETRNTLFRLAYGMSVGGKPFVVSEYNHAFPNEYQAEFPLILSSYSSFQDWDGGVIHQYAIRPDDLRQKRLHDAFSFHNNPVLLTQMPVASLIFRREDIRPSDRRIQIPYTQEQALRAYLDCGLDIYCVLSNRNLDPEIALVNGVDNRFPTSGLGTEDARLGEAALNIGPSPYESDTGQLRWDLDQGLVLVDADTVQAAVGFVGGQVIRLKHVTIQAQTDFAAISLVALDGKPIPRSQKLLITAASRVKNEDMEVKRDVAGFYLLTRWGEAPVLVQDVRARIRLRHTAPDDLEAFRLDERGRPSAELQSAASGGGDELMVEIGGEETLWYGLCTREALSQSQSNDVRACEVPTRLSPMRTR